MTHAVLLGTSEADLGDLPGPDGWSIIEVRHASKWFGAFRDFEVSIDGYVVGRVGRRSPGRYRVAPGSHTLTARMDWVRIQCASIVVEADEHAVFRCGMADFYARVWAVGMVMLGLLIAGCGIWSAIDSFFPGLNPWKPWIFVCEVPCFFVLGVCEFVVFGGMTPCSPPGRVMRLSRLPSGGD